MKKHLIRLTKDDRGGTTGEVFSPERKLLHRSPRSAAPSNALHNCELYLLDTLYIPQGEWEVEDYS